jgi:hypothetical protein
MRSVLLAGAVLAAHLAGATPAAAQRPPTHPSVAAARVAQRDFERRRRDRLPSYRGGGASGPCEVRIGRLCYWNNNTDAPPPPEPAAVAVARDGLIERLAAAAAADSSDDWVVGQRVRYLAEAGRFDDAVAVAAACRATPWWCDALRGLAFHERGERDSATVAYDRALAALPAPERCRWPDLAWWLDGALERDYRRQPCGPARDAWARRFHLAARPLLALPGDDLRDELLARRTMSRIRSQGAIEYQMSWGDDFAELEARYGWPTAWTVREPNTMMLSGEPRSVVGHEPTPSFAFVPRAGAVASPVASRADDWELGARLATMRYAPRYAWRGFSPLAHQIARFRRGDSTLVVAAWSVASDRAWHADSQQPLGQPPVGAARRRAPLRTRADSQPFAALVLVDSAGATRSARDSVVGARGAVALLAPGRQHLASLELLDPARGRAARARYGIAPLPADTLVSDLLLLARAPAPDTPVERLLGDALGTRTLTAGTTVGLYWETYLPPDTSAAQVSVQATRIDAAWYDRVGRALHLGGGPRTPVAVRYVDAPRPGERAAGRALALTWPAHATGTFRVEVTVRVGAATATAVEVVRVVP